MPIIPKRSDLPGLPVQPQGGNNGSPHQTGNVSVPVSDSGVDIRQGRDHFDGLENFIESYLQSGQSIGNDQFKWLFQLLWERQNGQMSENWAREDAFTAWQRSLASADYNAQLGLDTAQASRAQLYNQLIALGMSPAAAMQAAAGAAGSGSVGSGSAGAPGVSTQSMQASPYGGANSSDRINSASTFIGALSGVAQSIGNIYSSVSQLRQNAFQFDQRLAFDKDAFAKANFISIGNANAASSDEFVSFWPAMNDYILNKVPGDAALSPYSALQYMLKDKDAKSLQDLYYAGRKAHGQYFDSQFYSNYKDMVGTLGGAMDVKLKEAALKNAMLDYDLKQVDLDKARTDFQWFCDKYSDYSLNRDLMNKELAARLNRDMHKFQMEDDPAVRSALKRAMLSDAEYQALYSDIQKIKLGRFKSEYIDDDHYLSMFSLSQFLSDLGFTGELGNVVRAGEYGLSAFDNWLSSDESSNPISSAGQKAGEKVSKTIEVRNGLVNPITGEKAPRGMRWRKNKSGSYELRPAEWYERTVSGH